jgi:hypothetical protein
MELLPDKPAAVDGCRKLHLRAACGTQFTASLHAPSAGDTVCISRLRY